MRDFILGLSIGTVLLLGWIVQDLHKELLCERTQADRRVDNATTAVVVAARAERVRIKAAQARQPRGGDREP